MFATAFERDDCKIFHLISPNDISPIYRQDKSEVFSVLQKLGSSSTDLLSTKGVIYLEGPHDTELLESAISTLMAGFTAKHLGGRLGIEKNIHTLQKEEQKGRLDSYQLFLFDLDNKPTDLSSTGKVRLLQWDRYCLENYLLESDPIFEVVKQLNSVIGDLSRGSMLIKLKEIAFRQINRLACKEIVSGYLNDNHYLRIKEIVSDKPDETVKNLYNVLKTVKKAATDLIREVSEEQILAGIQKRISEITDEWQSKWVTRCDGKAVIAELHREFKIPKSHIDFKKKILELSRIQNYENWRLIESKIKELLPEK